MEKIRINYESSVFFVKDIKKTRDFYLNVLKQKIEFDFGRNIVFKGGLSFWDEDYALRTIYDDKAPKMMAGKNNSEIYFETEQLELVFNHVKKENATIIHKIMEHPWGQRGFRFYDQDNHIIEIGEPMEAVVRRLFRNGLTLEAIAEKTTMPMEFIKDITEKME